MLIRKIGAAATLMAVGLVTVAGGPAERAGAAPLTEALVSVSFDDGWKTQWDNVRPELNSRGFKGTFALLTQPLRENWTCCFTIAQARQLQTEGHEIASHSVNHPNLTTLSPAALATEITTAKAELQGWFGGQIPGFVSPLGAYNNDVLATIRTNHRWHRTINPGLIDTETYIDQLHSYDANYFTRAQIFAVVDQAIAEKRWAILTFHEIVNSGAASSTQLNKADFVAILNHIRSRGVRVVTVSEGVARLSGRTTPPSPPGSAVVIYDDALRNGYLDYSWAVHQLAQSAVVRTGGSAISFEPDGWGALYLAGPQVTLAANTVTDFWVHGGAAGGQNVNVAWYDGSVLRGRVSVDQVLGRPIPAGAWTQVSVSLTAMGIAPGTPVRDLYLQDGSGGNQSVLYVDDIRIVGGTPPATTVPPTTVPPTTVPPTTFPPATVPPTTVPPTTVPPTTVPPTTVATLAIYDDQLRNGFQNWSWATVNLANLAEVRSGSSIRVEPDNWAALYVHADSVNLSQYSTLRFWIYPTGTGGQLIDVVGLQSGVQRGRVRLSTVMGRPLTANTWQEVVLPLTQLGSASGAINELYIQDASGANQSPVAIDDLIATR
jgi:peptidoglycan/xylan/chitin deacetylase (PgdA/CDA1 family)